VYVIAKQFSFSASHQLTGLPDGHKCARLHGHNYLVEVQLAAEELDGTGFVADFADLTPVRTFIDSSWDHRHLNDVLDGPPTSERLAQALFTWCKCRLPAKVSDRLHAVRVSETSPSWAEFRR
jgi:6-pyruvoyltetrahydropterin/6-carboxytetrahydropterin synthase